MSESDKKYSTVHYQNYLGLDKILDAQHMRSGALDARPAHEEMLFIIIHQTYELWFKQTIHELESVLALFNQDEVDEKNIGISISRLERVIEIFNLLIEQIKIMETMTPLDFLDFRNYLFPASGFQSFQFRKIENLLGLEVKQRITYNGCPYNSVFSDEKQEELLQSENDNSLFDALENWLERTPFLKFGDFDFLDQYKSAVKRMLDRERVSIEASSYLDENETKMRLQMLGNTNSYFQSVFDKSRHDELIKSGSLRLSYDATLAALLIHLYRDQPLLHLPFRLLTCFVEMDDALTTWRYRHAQMVMRMLGNKIGTGGSSGHEYLAETAVKHTVYKDLHNISTLLIPRSEIPDLPKELLDQLSFHFSVNENK